MGLLKMDVQDSAENRDRAAAKMKSSLRAKPFKVSKENLNLQGCERNLSCQSILAVSSFQQGLPFQTDNRVPIVQRCLIRDVYGSTEITGSVFLTNCRSAPGGSASVNFLIGKDGKFLRDERGSLIPIGIFTGGRSDPKDDQPYCVENKKFTKSVAL